MKTVQVIIMFSFLFSNVNLTDPIPVAEIQIPVILEKLSSPTPLIFNSKIQKYLFESVDCEEGEVEDCYGDCASEDWLGDGGCDDEFDCEEFNYDNGDCQDDGPPECALDCEGIEDVDPEDDPYGFCNWLVVLDQTCLDDCDEDTFYLFSMLFDACVECLENDSCDGIFSDDCEEGEIEDCYGDCAPEDWLGDGGCDDEFNCEEFNYDYGDCEGDDGPPETMNFVVTDTTIINDNTTYRIEWYFDDDLLQIQYWIVEDSTGFVRYYAFEDDGELYILPDAQYLVPSESMEIGDTWDVINFFGGYISGATVIDIQSSELGDVYIVEVIPFEDNPEFDILYYEFIYGYGMTAIRTGYTGLQMGFEMDQDMSVINPDSQGFFPLVIGNNYQYNFEFFIDPDYGDYGCIDGDALNFNPDATLDDESCIYDNYSISISSTTGISAVFSNLDLLGYDENLGVGDFSGMDTLLLLITWGDYSTGDEIVLNPNLGVDPPVFTQLIIDGILYFAMAGPWATGSLQFTEIDGFSNISAVFSDDAQLGLFDASIEGGDPMSAFIGIINIDGGFSFTSQSVVGDLNQDGEVNIQDIVIEVGIILEYTDPTEYELSAGDLNDDGAIDIFDIILMVNIILG